MKSRLQELTLPAVLLWIASSAAYAAPEPDFVVRATKVLTGANDGPAFFDDAVVVVRDGRISAVGPAGTTRIPADLRVIDVGDRWLMPGMVDLHSHVGGTFDINDGVFQTNPGLRVSPAVVPRTMLLQRAIAGGVTTILFIPGSGNNMSGQGILLKTSGRTYADMRLRDPGSLKIAQGDNPTRWGYQMGRSLMNFHMRDATRKGMNYAEAWRRHEEDGGERPEVDIQYEIFRPLRSGDAQISAHTQIYQLVLTTITMFKGEFGLDVFLDHSSFDGFKASPIAESMGVAAICGPRELGIPLSRGCQNDIDGSLQGTAAGFQERGHPRIGFNTDAPVIPQEELSLQSAMGARYGFDNASLQAVRGLTIVPAMVAGIEARVGSLEVGKDADLLVITGDPSDPRTAVDRVWVDGVEVYDASVEERLW